MSWDVRRTWLSAVVGAVVALYGCDDGEAEPARVKHCRTVCTQLDMCIRETDLAECEDRCDQQAFRSDGYYEAKARCVTSLSCNEWDKELDSRGEDVCTDEDDCNLASCVGAELSRQKVNADQEQYCVRLSNKLAPCEGMDAAELALACEDRLLELSAEYAAETEDCIIELSCPEIPRCLDDLADMYGTDLTVFPRI
jgi:hypothetical protein